MRFMLAVIPLEIHFRFLYSINEMTGFNEEEVRAMLDYYATTL